MRRPLLTAAALASALLLAGCGTPPEPAPTESDALHGEITVYAAASLRAAFDEIAAAFSDEHAGVVVKPISYDGSSTLATQIVEGASVDVFASADENNMNKVTEADLAADPVLFATNTLVIATPQGNPAGIRTLADLADPAHDVVLCAPEVPCGAASIRLLDAAGVIVTPASLEQNVTAVLTKVEADEADAGLVYATDVVGKAVESIVPEGAGQVVNRYPIVALKDAPNPAVAQAFADFVLGPQGAAILAKHGFGAP